MEKNTANDLRTIRRVCLFFFFFFCQTDNNTHILNKLHVIFVSKFIIYCLTRSLVFLPFVLKF